MSEPQTGWSVIRDSLDDYRPKDLFMQLARLLHPRVPPDGSWPNQERQALFTDVERLVAAQAGRWYAEAGGHLLDEVFSGYCSCHGFFNHNPPDRDVAVNVRRILDALRPVHGWLRSLDAYFRTVRLPEDEGSRAEALSAAVRQVVTLTVEASGCNESWYVYAGSAIEWLLQSQGLEVTPELQRTIEAACGTFTSWVAPTDEQSVSAADVVAFAAVRAEFESRYGAS